MKTIPGPQIWPLSTAGKTTTILGVPPQNQKPSAQKQNKNEMNYNNHISTTIIIIMSRYNRVTFGDLDEDDMQNLAQSIEYALVPKENSRLGKPLWEESIMEIPGAKTPEEIKKTYTPSLYMLKDFMKKIKSETVVLRELKYAAKKVNRCDVVQFISELQITDPLRITPQDLHHLSEMLETTLYSRWNCWKSLADVLHYDLKEIDYISYLATPSMKAVCYIKDHHPNTSIMLFKNTHMRLHHNGVKCGELLNVCLSNIKEKINKDIK